MTRTQRRRAAASQPEDAVAVTDAPEAEPAGLGFEKWMGFLGNFVAPFTLITALLFYFGYVSSRAFFLYFGVDVDVLSLSNQQFAMRSPGALFVPVTVLLLIASGLIVGHRLLRRRLRRTDAASQARIVSIFGWAGVLALVAGLVLAFSYALLAHWGPYAFVTPALLAIGAGLAAYAAATARSLTGAKTGRSLVVLLVAVMVAGTFWATATVAGWWGLGQARIQAADFSTLPAVVLDATAPIAPGNQAITGVDLNPGKTAEETAGQFRYRYHGLRLLVRGGDYLFLVPDVWSADASTLVIPIDDAQFRFRFRFFPDENPPD